MKKWTRLIYHPNFPLEENYVTGSPAHARLSLEAAREGMVLLKNKKSSLPLEKGSRLALFGKGTFDYVRGGGGSGEVYPPYVVNIYDGIKKLGFADVYQPLADFYKKYVEAEYAKGMQPGMMPEAELPAELLEGAAENADTAVFIISRFSGEGWDRSPVEYNAEFNPWPNELTMPQISSRIFPRGDFYLSDQEIALLESVKEKFDRVIVLLNIGGIIDTSWIEKDEKIDAALLTWQGGMEGGQAAADLLFGLANPCGKLADTFTAEMTDYPSTENFHESPEYVDYTEDIYVGYRYFETVPGAAERVVYPFGYGLSYTEFERETIGVNELDGTIYVMIRVKNIGKTAGKEVVQLYYSAPCQKLQKPALALAGFAKTPLLAPGEETAVSISVRISDMASYDDLGKVAASAWVLEKGVYQLYAGSSVRDNELIYEYLLEEDTVTEQLSAKMVPTSLPKRMLADGSYEALPVSKVNDWNASVIEKVLPGTEEGILPAVRAIPQYMVMNPYTNDAKPLLAVAEGKLTVDEYLEQLPDEVLMELLGGTPNEGVANTSGFGGIKEYGIPAVMTADGPAGIRINPDTGVRTTAWPCATMLACTWNPEMVERIGVCAAKELKENNLGVWLAPAVNIHRNPLCGRNFEYYSEDPYLTGKIGAAMVKGVQTQKVAATIKHFAANNKETNRKQSDSRVSERALREIYLKQFEIIVKEADPWVIMSSYNIINGHRASENKDLLEGILREEWGYQGVVTTDWWTRGEHYKEVLAGNDIKMACGFPDRLKLAREKGALTREDLLHCARRILELFLKLD